MDKNPYTHCACQGQEFKTCLYYTWAYKFGILVILSLLLLARLTLAWLDLYVNYLFGHCVPNVPLFYHLEPLLWKNLPPHKHLSNVKSVYTIMAKLPYLQKLNVAISAERANASSLPAGGNCVILRWSLVRPGGPVMKWRWCVTKARRPGRWHLTGQTSPGPSHRNGWMEGGGSEDFWPPPPFIHPQEY